WYVSRHPESALKTEWPYLRYREDGTPAAGTFPTWPETVAAVTVMDPCCGSGHFLVAALHMLVAMRQEVEGLAQAEAVDAVLRDNLFGLELDARCTQIATFAVALEAWKLGGHPERHLPHIACSGIPVSGQKQQWTKLAGRDVNMATALEQLYDAFAQASELGSLIDPKRAALMRGGGERGQRGISLVHEWEETERHLHRALMDEQASDPAAQIFSLDDNDLVGTLRAAQLLSRTYTLVVTNVPFLSRGNHGNDLMAFADRNYPEARSNLATMLYFRILGMIQDGGSLAGFSLYDWYFLDSYKDMRRILLDTVSFQIIANLGFKSFRTPMWDFNIGLTILTNSAPSHHHCFAGFDVSNDPGPLAKSESLLSSGSSLVVQLDQHANPDWRILLRAIEAGPRLEEYAEGLHGLGTKDPPRFIRTFWEVNELGVDWNLLQSTPKRNFHYGGLEQMIFWEQGQGLLHERNRRGEAILAGRAAYGREGAIISQMGTLSSAIYMKGLFDKNVAAIVPKSRIHFMAVYAFCSSPQFHDAVRILDAKLYVTNTTLVKVPFNLEHWQAVADERYPDGLPEPFSSDPTQWLFEGTVPGSDHPLQVAMARLLGYRWPDQVEDGLDALADPDGIICLPSVYREPAAADRLRGLLERAYGEDWSAELLATLLRDAGASSLDGWLRDKKGFFAQHVKLFHNRPFLWQISDGRKDGFAAVVNYHRLTTRTLEKLIYTYLEDWINRQRRAADRQEAGAQAGLEAATRLRQELIKIAGGEPPYDIYVRWKSLAEQPIGWEPDLNDGVRLNIRPFIEANVLASKVNVKWGKDRGNDPAVRTEPLRESADADLKSRIDRHTSVERHNDLHFSRAEKVRARQLAATEATAPV
ncbi:MAG: DNA methyltransferase, partial [Thermomicrobiales bacterium]